MDKLWQNGTLKRILIIGGFLGSFAGGWAASLPRGDYATKDEYERMERRLERIEMKVDTLILSFGGVKP